MLLLNICGTDNAAFFTDSSSVIDFFSPLMLDELSITSINLDSSSAEIHPGINPLVTGLEIISTNAVINPILNKRRIHFFIFTFLIALFYKLLIKRMVLKSTFLIDRRLKIWIIMGMPIALRNNNEEGDNNVIWLD